MPDSSTAMILQALFWVAAMSILMRWPARSRLRPRRSAGMGQMRHPPGILALGIVGAPMFAGIWPASHIWPDVTGGILIDLGFGALTLLALFLSANYCSARHEVTADGMRFGRALGQFAHLLLRHVPAARIATATRIRLQDAMQRKLRRLWP